MSKQVWKPNEYDRRLSFVSAYGKGVVQLLSPQPGERILDLGCGTGDLAYEISASGAHVTGMDDSSEMIERAKSKYPGLTFVVGDGENFNTETSYDAVFSNAALHWIKDAASVVRSVYDSLKPGGRFVAEFGGKGNIDGIYQALKSVFARHYGIDADARNPWYFPSLGQYATLLESQGFRVHIAHDFDRPTKLPDGKDGIKHWLVQFGDHFFTGFSVEERNKAIDHIRHAAQTTLWHKDAFYADYKRLRIFAEKTS